MDASRHTVSNLPEHAATEAVPAPVEMGHSAPLPSPFQAASSDKRITPNHTDTLSGLSETDSQVSALPHVPHPRVTGEVKNASVVSAPSPQESLIGRPVQDTNPPDVSPNPFPKLVQTNSSSNDQVMSWLFKIYLFFPSSCKVTACNITYSETTHFY